MVLRVSVFGLALSTSSVFCFAVRLVCVALGSVFHSCVLALYVVVVRVEVGFLSTLNVSICAW